MREHVQPRVDSGFMRASIIWRGERWMTVRYDFYTAAGDLEFSRIAIRPIAIGVW